MEDVIFGGTDQKKPLNLAQVSMLFDNSGKELDIAYDEVMVTRKLFRSGETAYSINKTNCRLKDIKSLFLDTGIGKDGYSMIGQGRIEEILSASDQDRRELFEEATGISRFRYQIEEAIRKLNKTQENLTRTKDIIASLDQQVAYLKKEAEKARKGMHLTAELEKHTIALYQQEWVSAGKQLAQLREQVRSLEEKQKEESQILAAAVSLLAPLQEEISARTEEKARVDEEAERRQKRVDRFERELGLSVQRSEFLQQDLERIAQSITSYEDDAKKWTEKLQEVVHQKGQLENEIEKERSVAAEKEEEGKEILADYERLEAALHEAETTRDKLEKQHQQAQLRLHAQQDSESFRAGRIERLTAAQEEEEARIHRAEEIVCELEARGNETQERLLDLSDQVKNRNLKLQESRERIGGWEKDLAQCRMQSEKWSARLSTLESMERNHEGYQKPVQHLLKRSEQDPSLKAHIVGPLGSLLRVEPHVQTAVEIALGQAVHNLVTPTGQDAKVLIDRLRDEKIGRATFLPIDRIKAYPYRGELPERSEAVIGPALAFLRFDESIRMIVESLLGRTVIVADVDTGLALRKKTTYDKLRFVTLQGDLLNPGGSMVGGYVHRDRAGLLSRETEQEVLREKLETVRRETESLHSRIQTENEKAEEVLVSLDQLNQSRDEARTVLMETQSMLAAEKAKRDVYLSQLEQVRSQRAEMENADPVADFEATIHSLAEQLDEMTTEVSHKRTAFQKSGREKDALDRERAQRVSKLDSMRRDLLILDNRKSDLEDSLQEKSDRYEKEVAQRTQIQAQGREEADKQDSLKNEIKQANEESAELGVLTRTLAAQIHQLQQDWDKQQQQVREYENALAQTTQDVATTSLRYSNAKEKVDALIQNVANELDMSSEDAETALQTPSELRTTRAKVRDLREALRSLGAFSYDSIEQYETVHEKYSFLQTQTEDLKKSSEDLKEVIAELEKQMRKQFRSGMKEINEKFLTIFQTLFEGGHAEIAMVGEDILNAGIQIIACPPGKTRQTLSLLSGGERSLTAVALLFAIFETRPSPFCVLDEIDAALDDANIARYKQYLESFRGRIQFIIITHRKQTMEIADVLYGVTMQDNSTSQIIPLELADKKNSDQ